MEQAIGLEVSVFLFTALVGYILAVRIGQSAVAGMILIGMLFGPSFLGIVRYEGPVLFLAEIGAIMLLFVVGLESNFRDIISGRNALIALSGVVFPFAGGYFISVIFGFSSIASLFIATSLTATSIAITAHVLKEMGKLGSDAGRAIIGAAVIDDILSLLLLAFTLGIGKGEFSAIGFGAILVSSLLFLMIAFLLMPFISEVISRVNSWAESAGHPRVTILLAMAIAFAYSAIAQFIGLSAIIGAFIAGVTLENLNIRSYREGAVYLEMIFSAIFFVSIGVLINVAEIDLGFAWFVIVLVVVAVVTKVIGCMLPAMRLGMRKKDAIAVGIGMVPRGEVAMIVALFGLTSGIISQTVYAAIMIMALATTLVAPYGLRKIFG